MTKENNPMREVKIEKIVFNVGGTGAELEKGVKLLQMICPGRKESKMKSTKRIPTLGVRPGLEVGAVITVRKDIKEVLTKMLFAVDKKLRKKQISNNNFSFGVKEYLEVPGMEYNREIGMMGFDVTVVFKRTGRRVGQRKIRKSKVPEKQRVTKEEIIKFMEANYSVKFR
jgi:large subunit ribosomal protein L5